MHKGGNENASKAEDSYKQIAVANAKEDIRKRKTSEEDHLVDNIQMGQARSSCKQGRSALFRRFSRERYVV
ncbi:hypothetical protein A3B85_00360 [Candidatus Nomurabacteria bacterium RIFCSPHIGHO2_02_FULL_37_13]|uniref:Uncharacterized protein n=1 Tax=Candidatus Nomurabacteria bacterium RIFCSPHIGHO2_02_FULL_37_13 TaxID=1801750 RepID=A0A1F6W448_9BACT|nr:MAG: hypothetical protein A2640_02380 [Candidatus Nomurabacteria bacterium RIFCSPHIGHO2_01_FULL_36_23]OGI76707.1 MAG: hypothetical protein A3B85_00360 [Candidatus Nomurabacteria bacterium RIFCSPHIGHO2_02_FULL_37_13]OGI86959.1 MAG: hypothetical protein A2906_00545 [Candidatus Nomurabacteria bacterium RIFCSPLOWO2_01_FULL_37_25]